MKMIRGTTSLASLHPATLLQLYYLPHKSILLPSASNKLSNTKRPESCYTISSHLTPSNPPSTSPTMHPQHLFLIFLPATLTLATAIPLPGGATRLGVACGTVHVASYCQANCPGRCLASGTNLKPGSICVCR
jgi:hypothetical protein